ncbi:MAG: dihydroorotate dehydrogenase electron transfer subunit [Coriobacteriia bacterium]
MTAKPSKPIIEAVSVVANDRITEGVGLMVLRAPKVAATVRPGQFVHLRLDTHSETILRRPFSVHRASGDHVELLYQVLGAGTLHMAEKRPGDTSMDVVGPLGHGWVIPDGLRHALLVAGGLGAAPLGMLAEHLAGHGVAVSIAQGAPTATRLVARQLFKRVARVVEVATDDGSAGERGLVTGPVARLLATERFDVAYTCGPEAMQRVVAGMLAEAGVPCQVSLERLMACGIGACLSCVVTTRDGFKRACVDGPVFNAEEVLWDASQIPPKH